MQCHCETVSPREHPLKILYFATVPHSFWLFCVTRKNSDLSLDVKAFIFYF